MEIGDAVTHLTASTTVLVTGIESASHASAAHKLLTTPNAHLVLILGGDHLDKGIAAIHKAVKDEVLEPHYAVIEAKRLATRYMDREPDLVGAKQMLKGDVVMSASEKAKMFALLE